MIITAVFLVESSTQLAKHASILGREAVVIVAVLVAVVVAVLVIVIIFWLDLTRLDFMQLFKDGKAFCCISAFVRTVDFSNSEVNGNEEFAL